MVEHLEIRNFGPIREANLEIRDLTIFVGPQATGKSLAAQVLYFLRALPEFRDVIPPDIQKPSEFASRALEYWLGNKPEMYVNNGATLKWTATSSNNSSIVRQLTWQNGEITVSDNITSGNIREQVYIPAGRSVYSFLPPFYRTVALQPWPGHVRTFYEALGRAIEQQNQEAVIPDKFIQVRIEKILKGEIQYSQTIIMLKVKDKLFYPATMAAGQMEIWPFFAILLAGLTKPGLPFPITFPINFSKEVYFEEPEAHLHPNAQKTILEIIAYKLNQKTNFLLTTHSPYILYAVNNFLMAQKVVDAGKPLPDGIPPEVALRPEQVAAYRFDQEGFAHNIMDSEVDLIDENELDRVADDLDTDFTRLQDQLGSEE